MACKLIRFTIFKKESCSFFPFSVTLHFLCNVCRSTSNHPISHPKKRPADDNWEYGTTCDCGIEHYHSVTISIIKVPMMNPVLAGGINVFRGLAAVVTLGISTQFNGGFKDPTHELVKIVFMCDACQKSFSTAFEFGSSYGAKQRIGEYQRECMKLDPKNWPSKRISLKYEKVLQVFHEMPKKNYSACNWNCSHWAWTLYGNLN